MSKAERDSLVPIFSHDIEGSVYNRLGSEELRAAIDDLVENHNYLLKWGSDALEKQVPEEIHVEVYRLRLNFWLEYEQSCQNNVKMGLATILRGTCSVFWFKEHIMTNPKALMYILHQPQDYASFTHECLSQSMKNIRKILREPFKKMVKKRRKIGKDEWEDYEEEVIDHKLIDQKIKIWEKAENRVLGVAPQRLQIESKSQNYNYNESASHKERSIEELEAEISKLESKKPMLDVGKSDESD